jgi:2-polyprenyl-3-methyl-5-hydroxy-6-metoxy-1,4-benzoquinol methylase
MKVITNYPIAVNSPDHLYPCGTAYNNSTDHNFITEIENYFGNTRINFLDIGCAGGQLVVDFNNRGHLAIGLEGSDYSVIHSRANWPTYHNKLLFTCDATMPYTIVDDNNQQIKFNCISAWEVIEHIAPEELDQFFMNVINHMHDTAIFVGSISEHPSYWDYDGQTRQLHQSIFSKNYWIDEILPKYFKVEEYPFIYKVRYEETSFWVKLMKK